MSKKDDDRDPNYLEKYRFVWAVLITILTLLVAYQLFQVAMSF